MDALHVVLGFCAGAGFALAWGYRTALHVALGLIPGERPPSEPASARIPVPFTGSRATREELTR